MKEAEIKAKELVKVYFQTLPTPCMNTYDDIFKEHKERSIQCAIICQQKEVDVLEVLNKEFVDDKHSIYSSNFIYSLLQEAQQVLTHLKEM